MTLCCRFSVEFTGQPPPVIQWFREGFEIQTSRDFQIMTTPTRSTLYIPEVFPEDTGVFTVKIHNQHGMAQCKAMLQVQGQSLISIAFIEVGCFVTQAAGKQRIYERSGIDVHGMTAPVF